MEQHLGVPIDDMYHTSPDLGGAAGNTPDLQMQMQSAPARRRRKIRCTYDTARPSLCNECYARGSTCIDQEHAPLQPIGPGSRSGEQTYSLRERVTILENTVNEILKRLDDMATSTPSSQVDYSPLRAATDEVKKELKDVQQQLYYNADGVSRVAPSWTSGDSAPVIPLRPAAASTVPAELQIGSNWNPNYDQSSQAKGQSYPSTQSFPPPTYY
ncbi:hypothetical protein AJ80_07189 [Polytolypa hystricis UAMH7299]|uniref:Zn(2)-C6 fungal-type domain-containing protein n=1 Tax=Polytolypa hystricis (strain UAMH7299) TaxID=1447883 RepID=A0A2B7XQP0_POLH7|nr:hypothetical protein AJ80_07189 [Polytolypa hystricis UAMH7299]